MTQRNGLAVLQALTQAHREAVEKFGPSREWDRSFVSRWMQRRVDDLLGRAPKVSRSWNEPTGE